MARHHPHTRAGSIVPGVRQALTGYEDRSWLRLLSCPQEGQLPCSRERFRMTGLFILDNLSADRDPVYGNYGFGKSGGNEPSHSAFHASRSGNYHASPYGRQPKTQIGSTCPLLLIDRDANLSDSADANRTPLAHGDGAPGCHPAKNCLWFPEQVAQLCSNGSR